MSRCEFRGLFQQLVVSSGKRTVRRPRPRTSTYFSLFITDRAGLAGRGDCKWRILRYITLLRRQTRYELHLTDVLFCGLSGHVVEVSCCVLLFLTLSHSVSRERGNHEGLVPRDEKTRLAVTEKLISYLLFCSRLGFRTPSVYMEYSTIPGAQNREGKSK